MRMPYVGSQATALEDQLSGDLKKVSGRRQGFESKIRRLGHVCVFDVKFELCSSWSDDVARSLVLSA